VTRDAVSGTARGYIKLPEHTNALAFRPDVVICNLGINDVSTFAAPHRQYLVRDYRELIAAYRALPTAPRFILWQPLAPLFPGQAYYGQPVVTDVNNLIRDVVNLTGADALDMSASLVDHPEWFPDHLHPNATGAQRIAEVTYGVFVQTVEPPAGSKLAKRSAASLNASQICLPFLTGVNLACVLQATPSLDSPAWTDVRAFDVSAVPRIMAATNPINASMGFYRLRLQLD
jgi:hypothetical protein